MTGYNSPLNDRYNSDPLLNAAWSDVTKLHLYGAIWTRNHNRYMAAAGMTGRQVKNPLPGMSPDQLEDLVREARKREEELTGHELVAYLDVFSKLFPDPCAFHTGLTSSDVQDQAVLIQSLWSLARLFKAVSDFNRNLIQSALLGEFDIYVMGRTHLQPAEPTTLLHRVSLLARELLDWIRLTYTVITRLVPYLNLLSGPVGTYADQEIVYRSLNSAMDIKDRRGKAQTLPRILDLYVAQSLDLLAAIAHKHAFDYRLEAGFGSIEEIAAAMRIGSSSMPYKHNPIRAEKIDSLCRHIHHLVNNAWDNAAWQGLERTLDDSANRRMWLPEAFLCTSEVVRCFIEQTFELRQMNSTPPESWKGVWSKARVKARDGILMAMPEDAGIPMDPLPNTLTCSIQTDKSLLDQMVKTNWPGWNDLGFLNVPGPEDVDTYAREVEFYL